MILTLFLYFSFYYNSFYRVISVTYYGYVNKIDLSFSISVIFLIFLPLPILFCYRLISIRSIFRFFPSRVISVSVPVNRLCYFSSHSNFR